MYNEDVNALKFDRIPIIYISRKGNKTSFVKETIYLILFELNYLPLKICKLKDLYSTAPKRGSVFIGLMVQYGPGIKGL